MDDDLENRKSHLVETSCETMAVIVEVLDRFAEAVIDDEEMPEEIRSLGRKAASLADVLAGTRHGVLNQIASLAEVGEGLSRHIAKPGGLLN